MAKKSLTKDETFLVKLYEMATAVGDYAERVDRYAVGRAINQGERSVDNIVKLMAQANFIKKAEDPYIYLTSHGMSLVNNLID